MIQILIFHERTRGWLESLKSRQARERVGRRVSLLRLCAVLAWFGVSAWEASAANTDPTEKNIIRLEPLAGSLEPPVITAMTVSLDGKYLAASGDDHAIRLVSIEDRKTIATWVGHIDWVRGLAFSPDGNWLASCANDGFLRVWKADSREPVLETKVDHALYALSFRGNNSLYAVGFGTNVFRLDIPAKTLSIDHECDCSDLRAIAVSPDGTMLAYAGRDGALRLRTLGDEKSIHLAHAPVHFDRVRSIQFSDDGQTITSVGEDRRVVHFDVESRSVVAQTEIRGGKLMGLCPLDASLFAVAGADNTIRIVAWNSLKPQVKLIGHDGSVAVLQKTAKYLISASFDTTIRLWDIEQAFRERDPDGRYLHPVSAQFEDSGTSEKANFVTSPIR